MKNRQKKIIALLLAGAMTMMPVSQVFAETVYDASAGLDQQILFPEDSLTGITAAVTVDGAEAALDESGAWKNTDSEKVYAADTAEDGSIQITQVGYEVEITRGTASLKEKEADQYHHYRFGDWEKPETAMDRAYYEEDEEVTIKADEPEEGMEFAGWKCDTEDVVIADPMSAETTFKMIDGKVEIEAVYTEKIPDPIYNTVTVNDGSGSGEYEAGTMVTVSASDRSAEGLEFVGWSIDSENVTLTDLLSAETSFVMPESAVVLSASYTLSVTETEPQTDPAPIETEPQTDLTPIETEPQTDPTPIETEPQTDPTPIETEPQTDLTPIETEPQTDPAPIETEPQTDPTPIETEPQTDPAPIETEPQTDSTPIETEPQTDLTPIETEPQTDFIPFDPSEETEEKFEVTVTNGIGSGFYAPGEIVSVEASYEGEDGELFRVWSVDGDSVELDDAYQAVTTFEMPDYPVDLTAEYAAPKYTITVENGTSDLEEAEAGTNVTVTSEDRLEEGLKFVYWEGTALVDGEESNLIFEDKNAQTTSFTMQAGDAEVKAVYEDAVGTYKVTVANGLINGTSTEMECEENEEIVVTANPSAAGQQFAKWEINDGTYDIGEAAYDETIYLTVTENLDIRATYEGISYSVVVKDGTANYTECVMGTVVTITAAEAPEGYEFDVWKVETANASLADAYSETTTFTMPEAEVIISASYKKISYKVNVENGTCDKDSYYAGDTVTVTSNYPASGRVFNKWEAVSGNVSFADGFRWKTTFTMPATDVSVRSTYKDGPSVNDNVILDLQAGGEYYIGDTIKFTASGAGMGNTNPNPGDYRYRPSAYQISNVSGVLQSPYSISMAIKEAGEYTVKITYNKDIFDGTNWISDGTTDTKSVSFKVIPKSAAVQTGDETPIAMVIALAVVSCAVFLILLVVFIRRRKNR